MQDSSRIPPAPILVATDLSSHAGRAETRAAMLAQSLGVGKLVLIHVVPQLPLEALTSLLERTPLETEQRLVDTAGAALRERARRLSEKFGIVTGTAVRIGRPHVEIVEEADALNAGLVVVGGYGAHLVRELFLGATAEKVLRKCQRPVLMVKQEPLSPYKRLLVPVDFSPSSVRALDWAQAVVGGAEIMLTHIYEVPYESTLCYAGIEEGAYASLRDSARRQAEQAIDALLEKRTLPRFGFYRRIEHGHPAAVLRDLAEEVRPDLILMGKHGKSEVEELLLGSVTKHVLFETRCDLLVTTAA